MKRLAVLRWVWILAVVPAMQYARAQAAVAVHDRQPLKVSGVLTMSPAGRLQFVTIAMQAPLQAPGSTATTSLALTGFHSYALLYARRGQPVTAAGVVMTEAQSPYYRDGMLLKLTSLRAGNVDLMGTVPATARVAADVGNYRAVAELPADLQRPWSYRLENGRDAAGMLRCSSNGGGDVVNCSCAEGFRVTGAQSTLGGVPVVGRVFPDGLVAQFDTENTSSQSAIPVSLTVMCSR